MGRQGPVRGRAFISYAREDSSRVDLLESVLREAGIGVWRDTRDLSPGQDWKLNIRRAISDDALAFLACFSRAGLGKARSYQNEELLLAVEELRLRAPGRPWLIPVRFDDCEVPDLDLGGGRTLSSVQRADLFGDWFGEEAARLVAVIRLALGEPDAGSSCAGPGLRSQAPVPGGHSGLPGRRPGPVAAGGRGAAVGPGARGPSQGPERLVSIGPGPVLLAGREGLVAELHARLTRDVRGGPRIVVLHGMGGAGKTSLAVAYARDHLAAHSVTWQLPAEDPVVLAAEFARLAAMMGAACGGRDSRDPVAVVHAWLAAGVSPWLLIFDNASGQGSVRQFLPPSGHGRVLITSQNALWPHGQGLEVPVLDGESAARFLLTRTGSADATAAADLAGELGGLPLALEQAGGYVVATGESLPGYLGLFRARQAEMLGRGEPAGYDKTVATTWSLAFTSLERQSPAAITLLRLLACCAPEPVPYRVLLQPVADLPEIEPGIAGNLLPLTSDPLAVADAVAALRGYSLVSLPDTGLAVVHQLVQAVTISQMPAGHADALRRAAGSLIQAATPRVITPANLWILRSLLPHAQAVLPDHSPALAEISNRLGRSGSYRAARDLCRRIAAARHLVLGPQHPDTVTARHDLAHWTGLAGDAVSARDQFTALLPDSERAYGPDDRHTLTTRHSIALWTGRAGDPAAARDQLAALLPDRVRVHGPGDPDTLNCRHGLANRTGEAGSPAAARDQLAELMPVMERELAPHQDILNCRHDLAQWTGEAGDATAARDRLAGLLPAMEQGLGTEHPDTLGCRHGLARWTGEAGNPAAARDELAELLPVMERQLGPEHPATSVARGDLARWTAQAEITG